jgi:hypothetical protein
MAWRWFDANGPMIGACGTQIESTPNPKDRRGYCGNAGLVWEQQQ